MFCDIIEMVFDNVVFDNVVFDNVKFDSVVLMLSPPKELLALYTIFVLLKRRGGLTIKIIPIISKRPQTNLYKRSLWPKNIAAMIIVGRGVENIIVKASPKGINETAINAPSVNIPLHNP